MRFGFHVSIAGGLHHAVEHALERACETVQLFSRNPRGWHYRPLDPADAARFQQGMQEHDIRPVFVHMPYLANLAAVEPALFRRSLESLIEDLKRAAQLGAPYLILHAGSAADPDQGIARMASGIDQAMRAVPSPNRVVLLLENTAGSGHELGHEFGQLRALIEGLEARDRIGIVLDTAHAFAAGYDLRTRAAVDRCLNEFDRTIGLDRLRLVHLNDSKFECGSRRDRHWHIGQGLIGQGMRHILRHPALQDLPFIMETPRTNLKEDRMNMAEVRRLLG